MCPLPPPPPQVTHVVSQTDVVRLLHKNKACFGAALNATIESLEMVRRFARLFTPSRLVHLAGLQGALNPNPLLAAAYAPLGARRPPPAHKLARPPLPAPPHRTTAQ